MKSEIKPRKEHIKNARARWLLLQCTVNGTEAPPPYLKDACQTQQSFSELKIEKKEIIPLSLNTLKLTAELAVIPGGWKELERLRKLCKNLFSTSIQADKKPTAMAALRLRKKELMSSEEQYLRGQAIMLRAYQDLLKTLRGVSSENPTAYQKLRAHEAIYDIRALYPIVESYTTLPTGVDEETKRRARNWKRTQTGPTEVEK